MEISRKRDKKLLSAVHSVKDRLFTFEALKMFTVTCMYMAFMYFLTAESLAPTITAVELVSEPAMRMSRTS